MSAILTEDLVKHFTPEIKAVDGIALDVPEGQIFGFLGPNGSVKTTTVRMLTTLLKPTSGRAEVAGLDVLREAAAVRQSIGVALQEAGLDDLQTGRELLELQGKLYGLSSGRAADRASHMLTVVDLEDAADRRVKTYSGGMKRRLDLAAALMHEPKIVFLDEPTTGLDPISRESVWRYVERLNREEGVTFFLTTQYLDEADRLAQDLAIMSEGMIVAQGSPAELKASIGADVITVKIEETEPRARAIELLHEMDETSDVREIGDTIVVYIRDGHKAIARIILLLDQASIQVDEVSLAQPTLDDVFLQKTGHHFEPADEPAGQGEEA